ncbi:hypothetical protein T4E_200 [Trichinella pseudospiralis]|uniref:Serine-threonine/tyrosine-protein kinase catalytic domain-containing protein n=1 Tax=Trichinella pseudospiralis TaxID=6337 RepID=A0A0V0YI90_TRIPS|nr:hypothetical protein T4E_200 [Trichinella pseudospiralis]
MILSPCQYALICSCKSLLQWNISLIKKSYIALRNCLWKNNTVKIADFGLAREGEFYEMKGKETIPFC